MAKAETRATLIKIIHVARRELGMDEPTYRAMLLNAGKADSTSRMDVRALQAVLEQAKRAGFKVRSVKPDRRQDTTPVARKARALWLFLHHLGAVRDPSERALATYVRRIAKVDDMHWAGYAAMASLIETMKKWAMRPQYLPAALDRLKDEVNQAHLAGGLSAARLEDVERARYALARLADSGAFDHAWAAWECLTLALGRPLPGELAPARPEAARA